MTELEIAIDLIVPDNTAYTVLVALRGLGYEALDRVERSAVVRIRAEAPGAEAGALVTKIKHAEVLFNPNKHRLSYAPADSSAAPPAASPAA